MKLRKLVTLFLVCLMSCSTLSVVDATISKEYDFTARNTYGDALFGFKVKITVETEQNDVWFVNNHYDVTFTITFNYINTSIYSYTWFGTVMVFDQPFLENLYPVSWAATKNSTGYVHLDDTATLMVQCDPTSQGRASFTPTIRHCTLLESYNTTLAVSSWSSNEPIYIDVQTTSAGPFSLPGWAYLAIGVIIGVFMTGAVFAIWWNGKRKSLSAPTPLSHSPVADRPIASHIEAKPEIQPSSFAKTPSFCPYCGTQNPIDSVFCSKCGKKLPS